MRIALFYPYVAANNCGKTQRMALVAAAKTSGHLAAVGNHCGLLERDAQ